MDPLICLCIVYVSVSVISLSFSLSLSDGLPLSFSESLCLPVPLHFSLSQLLSSLRILKLCVFSPSYLRLSIHFSSLHLFLNECLCPPKCLTDVFSVCLCTVCVSVSLSVCLSIRLTLIYSVLISIRICPSLSHCKSAVKTPLFDTLTFIYFLNEKLGPFCSVFSLQLNILLRSEKGF